MHSATSRGGRDGALVQSRDEQKLCGAIPLGLRAGQHSTDQEQGNLQQTWAGPGQAWPSAATSPSCCNFTLLQNHGDFLPSHCWICSSLILPKFCLSFSPTKCRLNAHLPTLAKVFMDTKHCIYLCAFPFYTENAKTDQLGLKTLNYTEIFSINYLTWMEARRLEKFLI